MTNCATSADTKLNFKRKIWKSYEEIILQNLSKQQTIRPFSNELSTKNLQKFSSLISCWDYGNHVWLITLLKLSDVIFNGESRIMQQTQQNSLARLHEMRKRNYKEKRSDHLL